LFVTAGDLYLSTRSGQRVQLLQPQPDSIDIGDIALGLSRQYRFNGHTTTPYTVAQHSVVVSYLVPAEHALQALLHDAAEAYIGDLPSPVKKLCPDFWLVVGLNAASAFQLVNMLINAAFTWVSLISLRHEGRGFGD